MGNNPFEDVFHRQIGGFSSHVSLPEGTRNPYPPKTWYRQRGFGACRLTPFK